MFCLESLQNPTPNLNFKLYKHKNQSFLSPCNFSNQELTLNDKKNFNAFKNFETPIIKTWLFYSSFFFLFQTTKFRIKRTQNFIICICIFGAFLLLLLSLKIQQTKFITKLLNFYSYFFLLHIFPRLISYLLN